MADIIIPLITGVAQLTATTTLSAAITATKLSMDVALWAGEKTIGVLWWYAWGHQREKDAYRAIVREEMQRVVDMQQQQQQQQQQDERRCKKEQKDEDDDDNKDDDDDVAQPVVPSAMATATTKAKTQ